MPCGAGPHPADGPEHLWGVADPRGLLEFARGPHDGQSHLEEAEGRKDRLLRGKGLDSMEEGAFQRPLEGGFFSLNHRSELRT